LHRPRIKICGEHDVSGIVDLWRAKVGEALAWRSGHECVQIHNPAERFSRFHKDALKTRSSTAQVSDECDITGIVDLSIA